MAKAPKPGSSHPVRRPAKLEPHDDPAVITADAQASVKAFTDLVRRSREAGGHDEDALKNDRPLDVFKQGQDGDR
jgi:hypothetical protein